MARYVGLAEDQYLRPIPGAYITVVDKDNDPAVLTDDDGNPITQPLKTDDFGGYYFNTQDGAYTISIYRSGEIVARLYNTYVGDVSILPAGSIVNSLGTSTVIAPSQNAITTGFAAATGASLVGFQQSGTAVTRTVLDKLRDTASPKDFGCINDGVADDTIPLQAYFNWCASNNRPALLNGKYKTTDTITSNVRLIDGGIDLTGNCGTQILHVPTVLTDLKPAIDIVGGMVTWGCIRGVRILGTQSYTMHDAPTWCPNPGNLPLMTAFAAGSVGFRVGPGNQVKFINCTTQYLKCGRLDDTVAGHVWAYDCSFNGWLSGVYVRVNGGDCNFVGGQCSGVFACVIYGTGVNISGQGVAPGANINTLRTHFAFSPYAFYQVNDANVASTTAVQGLSGIFDTQLERIGEAIICQLPNTDQNSLQIRQWSHTWGFQYTDWENTVAPSSNYTNLHPSIIPYASQQQYALRLGSMGTNNQFEFGSGFGIPLPSTAGTPANNKIALVYQWSRFHTVDDTLSDFSALQNSIDVTQDAGINFNRGRTRMGAMLRQGALTVAQSMLSPNLFKNPEVIGNWTAVGSAPISITNATTVGLPIPQQMIDELGSNPVVFKLTGTAGGAATITPNATMAVQAGRAVGFSCWVACSDAATNVNIQIGTTGATYYAGNKTGSNGKWLKFVGKGRVQTDQIVNCSVTSPGVGKDTFVAGLMLFYDDEKPYNPSPNPAILGAKTTTTAPAAGGAGALPATPKGYMFVNITGIGDVEVPYY